MNSSVTIIVFKNLAKERILLFVQSAQLILVIEMGVKFKLKDIWKRQSSNLT